VIELRRTAGAFARVGHRGASALAPENTLEAFLLAAELGCDMLELDVLAQNDGTIVVAHDPRHLRDPGLVTFDDALAFFAERLPNVGLQIDLKGRGIELRVVDALKRHGALERSWVSGFDPEALRLVADLEPSLPRSFTYPRDRLGVSKRGPLAPLVRGVLKAFGASLPGRIPTLLRRARATALTLHYSVASSQAIERAHELGVPVYVWTVDDRALVERLARWEADGIITNDPRVFSGLTT
jgi:glycerophosphoryl diester phosphodiesterase